MTTKQIILYITIAFLTFVLLAETDAFYVDPEEFNEKLKLMMLRPHYNAFGEFVDLDTECNGKPCYDWDHPDEALFAELEADKTLDFCATDTVPEKLELFKKQQLNAMETDNSNN
ncbi:hypothetical protein FBU30_006853 [Linnemannia zychae]|nr:hypothetical protein FBU30_006853 [Linnemannia zychae]